MFTRGATDRQRLATIGLIAFVIVLTAIAVSLALAVLGRAGGPVAVSATPPPSASAEPSATTTGTAAASTLSPWVESPAEATAAPTPTPDPGPQAAIAVESWVRADVRLNMRQEPGLSAGLRALLEPGQVMLAVEGPVTADGFDWYRVIPPIEGAQNGGWIASGPKGDPFASVLSGEHVLRTCGTVEPGGVVAGLRFWWSLDELEQAISALLSATGGDACVSLDHSSESIAVYVDASVTACGEPRWEDGEVWLLPSVAGDVVADMQVKQRVHVSELLLTTDAVLDTEGQSNRHRVLGLASEADPPFACVHARVTETLSGRDTYFMTDSANCYLIEEATNEYALVRAQPGGTLYRLEQRAGGGYVAINVGTWSPLNVTAMYSQYDGQFMSLYGQPGTCSR